MYSFVKIYLSEYPEGNSYKIYNEVKDSIPEQLKDREEFQCKPKGKVIIPLPRDSETYKKVLDLAEKYDVYTDQFETTEYTKEEIKSAPFFLSIISAPLELEGTHARDYGTKYTDCCPVCQIGGTLVGDVLVDRKFVKKCNIASLQPDIFVSKQVKWLIESNGLTGVRFERMVKDYKGREIPEYYCMTIDNILEPMHGNTLFDLRPPAKTCEACGIQVPYLRSHCYYRKEAFDNAKDFNLTYEFVDNWAERELIVSRKVKEVFDKAKIRVGYKMLNILDK